MGSLLDTMPELVAEVSFELQSTKYPSSIPVSCELIFSENDFHQTEKLNKNGDIWSSSTLFYLGAAAFELNCMSCLKVKIIIGEQEFGNLEIPLSRTTQRVIKSRGASHQIDGTLKLFSKPDEDCISTILHNVKWSLKVFEAEESDTEEDSSRKKERSTHKRLHLRPICFLVDSPRTDFRLLDPLG